MKKNILLLFLFLFISSIGYFAISNNWFAQSTSLPNPKAIPFNDQRTISNYNWALIGVNGDQFNFITRANSVNFIHFFDVEKEYTLEELKTLNKFYKEYKTKVNFYFITKGDQLKNRSFLDKNNFTFPVYYSLATPPLPIVDTDYPNTILLSKKGRAIYNEKNHSNWTDPVFYEIVNSLLKDQIK